MQGEENEDIEKSMAAFYQLDDSHGRGKGPADQSAEDAAAAFHGIDPTRRGLDLGEPIPGYSGANQRVEADNVFGMTYAEARRRAKDSLQRIEVEKGETLKQTATFIPEYKRAQEQEW